MTFCDECRTGLSGVVESVAENEGRDPESIGESTLREAIDIDPESVAESMSEADEKDVTDPSSPDRSTTQRSGRSSSNRRSNTTGRGRGRSTSSSTTHGGGRYQQDRAYQSSGRSSSNRAIFLGVGGVGLLLATALIVVFSLSGEQGPSEERAPGQAAESNAVQELQSLLDRPPREMEEQDVRELESLLKQAKSNVSANRYESLKKEVDDVKKQVDIHTSCQQLRERIQSGTAEEVKQALEELLKVQKKVKALDQGQGQWNSPLQEIARNGVLRYRNIKQAEAIELRTESAETFAQSLRKSLQQLETVQEDLKRQIKQERSGLKEFLPKSLWSSYAADVVANGKDKLNQRTRAYLDRKMKSVEEEIKPMLASAREAYGSAQFSIGDSRLSGAEKTLKEFTSPFLSLESGLSSSNRERVEIFHDRLMEKIHRIQNDNR